MRLRTRRLLGLLGALSVGAAAAQGCSAASTGGSGGGATTTTTSKTTTKTTTGGSSTSTTTEETFTTIETTTTTTGSESVITDPCGTKCGPTELCDAEHLGFDDNCNGLVDENCGCAAGQVHWCFKGEPSYRGTAGCYDGTERCNELGKFGGCVGGSHATDRCFEENTDRCHAISARPFANVDLKQGTGTFDDDAVSGTETFTVTCPVGVTPCPTVTAPAFFKPLQSGEYTVTYTKGVSGGGTTNCSFPLYVGAPGLRVELTWEHPLGMSQVDLDLHVHRPGNAEPWGTSNDCRWNNCKIDYFNPVTSAAPTWFADPPAAPPTPVNWFHDPVRENNGCYFAPRGVGAKWEALMDGSGLPKGCHNPRLDLDNITCDPSVTNSDQVSFCAPENINIDFPPGDAWTRVAVHYYDANAYSGSIHPVAKIFCHGSLAAELGNYGYDTAVTFTPTDGGATSADDNRFWLVADVRFKNDRCGKSLCDVRPIYKNPTTRTAYSITRTQGKQSIGPAYPAD